MRATPDALYTFIIRLLIAHGAGEAQAAAVARHMVWCEMAGRGNFGVERLAILIKRMQAGVLSGNGGMFWEALAPGAARLDAGNGFGYDAAERAMLRAVELAKATGVGVAGVRNSNFFGAGAYYVNIAAHAGMIGLALSNSFPKVAAHGGIKAALGTNPLAFGAPRGNGRHLLVDMATSGLAGSTVRDHMASGAPLPAGLAVAGDGQPITDPALVASGALLPFGGAKGFGLALLVEVLAGVLTGAGTGAGVASMYEDFNRGGDNGHLLLAIDISRWMSRAAFDARFETLVAAVRASGPATRLPGEMRWKAFARAEREGVELREEHWRAMVKLASAAGIPAIRED